MLVSHLHQTEKNSFHFLLTRHLWCALHDASGCPPRLAGCPPRHSGVAADAPYLQHGRHAPTPSLPVRAEGDSETAHLQLSYASLCHPCCPSSRDLRVAVSPSSTIALISRTELPAELGQRIATAAPVPLRVAYGADMITCPCFQRRLQMCR